MTHWLQKIIQIFESETADLRQLALLAGGDPRIFYRGISLKDLDIAGQNLDGMEFGDQTTPFSEPMVKFGELIGPSSSAIRTIKEAKTQEERLALLVQAILYNRTLASHLVGLYKKDRGRFATLVISDLIDILDMETRQGNLFENELIKVSDAEIVHIVFNRFRRGMQMNRILLLYFMAKHLHQFSEVNAYLRARYERSWSIYLQPYKKDIENNLYRNYSRHARY